MALACAASSSRMPSRSPPRPIWSGRPSACAAASSTVSPAAISSTRSRSIANRRDTSSLASPESTRIARCSDSASSTDPTSRRSDAALPPTATAASTGGSARPSNTPCACWRIACRSATEGGSERRYASVSRPEPEAERLRPRGAVGHRADRELRRPAPDVDDADRAVERLAERARGAEEGQARLLLAVEDLDLDAADRADRGRELVLVGRPPDRRRRHDAHRVGAELLDQLPLLGDHAGDLVDLLARDLAALEALADAREGTPLEHLAQRAVLDVGDQHASGVGPDVDAGTEHSLGTILPSWPRDRDRGARPPQVL